MRTPTETGAIIVAIFATVIVDGTTERQQHADKTFANAKAATYGDSLPARFSLVAGAGVVEDWPYVVNIVTAVLLYNHCHERSNLQ